MRMAPYHWAACALGLAGLAIAFAPVRTDAGQAAVSIPHPRVASVTLCGDEYALRLSDPGQIASVSRGAVRALARFPERASRFPRNNKQVEELLSQDVDVVILESGGDTRFAAALRSAGIETVMLPSSRTHELEGIADGLRRIATSLGHPKRAEPIIAQMNARAAKLAADMPPEVERPIIAYFRPEGGGAGKETYINTAIEMAGFRNMQAMAGQTGWKRMAMENIVDTPPGAFIISFFDTQRNSRSAVQRRNPLLARLDVPVIDVPGRYWVCASPSILDASLSLHAARLRLFPRKGPTS